MLVLGFLLVLLAAGVVAVLLFGGSGAASIDLGNLGLIETNVLVVFLIGGATLLLLVVGLGIIRTGLARANKRRKEKRELTKREKKLEQREEHLEEREAGAEPTRTETRTDRTTTAATEPDGSHRRDGSVPPA